MVFNNSISVFYLSIGSGHQIAAEAIAHTLGSLTPHLPIRVVDPFANNIEILPSVLEKFQIASVVLTPGLYDSLWRRGKTGSLFEKITELDLLQDILVEELTKNSSSIVVATHVLPAAIAATLKKQKKLLDKVFGIVTDFGLHSFWPTTGLDGYFVGHDELRHTLIYRGVAPEIVYSTGIPIRPEFKNNPKQSLVLSNGKLRALLVVGGIRSGSYIEVQQYVFELLDAIHNSDIHHLHLTIVTGNQQRLQEKLTLYTEKVDFDLEVLGYVSDMAGLMANHDILVSKPGGLIIAEALAIGMCLILFRSGPGQESANVDFLARHGVAFAGDIPSQVVEILRNFIVDPSYLYDMRCRAKALGSPQAAELIAHQILKEMQ